MTTQLVCILLLACQAADPEGMVGIHDASCQILFDRASGALCSVANVAIGDECLKGAKAGDAPWRIYLDFSKEYELGDDLTAISRTVLQPTGCRLKGMRHDKGIVLSWEGGGLDIEVAVIPAEQEGMSEWSFRVHNPGKEVKDVLPVFPCFGGVRLGRDPAGNLATVMNQAGTIGPAWKHSGGYCGHGGQWSMQWHAIWDPASRSALGLIVMDPEAKAKQLRLVEPNIEVVYFPPVKLGPGETFALPPVKLLVYAGDWRPAARAYRAWYDKAFTHAELPAWFRDCDCWDGRHFKKAGPGVKADYGTQFLLDSFRDLPGARLRIPFDNSEYAFYSRGSMLYGKHTDGDNIIREDLGGAEAMREGTEGVHRLGLHTTLYIEGYIVAKESDLAKAGKAERWSVMHKDGTIDGPYTKQGFYHMCPGCTEWQDHLADTAARLLRETGVDGIRLDSLGFYFLPCYNPAHNHASPFGYNEWMKQLLAKVREAAISVNPDAVLTTEAPVDWYGQWFHGALTQVYPRDLPPMRLAVAPYRPIVYAPGGPVWGCVSGLAGGRTCSEPDMETLEGNWICARHAVNRTLLEGDVSDADPKASDPAIVARQFRGDRHWAAVAVRPVCEDAFKWPESTGLSQKRGEYTLRLAGLGASANGVPTAVLCDVETLTWLPLAVERQGDDLVIKLSTNWALVVLSEPDGPTVVDLAQPPPLHPGGSTVVRLTIVSGTGPEATNRRASLTAAGLEVSPDPIGLPGEAIVKVPSDALPGFYAVTVSGANVLGTRRFLKVE